MTMTMIKGAGMRHSIDIRIRATVVVTFTLFLLTGCAAGNPTLQQIFDRNVEALGGREALEALEGRTVRGRQIDDRPYAGPPVTSRLEARADTAGHWSMTLADGDEVYAEGRDEDGSWSRKPGEEAKPQDRSNAKLGYLLDPQGPLNIADHFPNPRLTGTRVFEGVTYWMVENDFKYEYYTLYFEVETGLLSRIGFHWWLEDFREVDGVMVPHTIVRGRKGGSTNLYWDEVDHQGVGEVSRAR
jgi:hypothetical protein